MSRPSTIIRLRDCPLQRWKNGLGSTREIAVQPSAAGLADFLWRVSIAEVDSAAPFSTFPGIDRQIVLLDGDGFTMHMDDGRQHALTTPFAPFAFAGEVQVAVTLAGGPTRDFNLMLRRGSVRGEVGMRQTPGRWLPDPAVVLVHAARGMIDTADGTLHAGDSWRPAPAPGDVLNLRDGALALVARILPPG